MSRIDDNNPMSSRELTREILVLLERKRCRYTSGELQADPGLASSVINSTLGKSEVLEALNRDRSKSEQFQKSTVYAHIDSLINTRDLEPYYFRADGESPLPEDEIDSAKNFRVRVGAYDPGGRYLADKLEKARIRPLCTFGMGEAWQTSLPSSSGIDGVSFVFDGGNELVALSLSSGVAKASVDPISIFFSQRVDAEEFSSRWHFSFRPDDWKKFGDRVTAFHVGRTDLYQMRWNIKSGPDPVVRGPAVGHVSVTIYPSGKYLLTCLGPPNSVGYVALSDSEFTDLLNFKNWARFGAAWPMPPLSQVEFLSEFPKVSMELKTREEIIPSGLKSKLKLDRLSRPNILQTDTWSSWSLGKKAERFVVTDWIRYLEENSVLLSGPNLVRVNSWYFLIRAPSN